jgi:hypothetical protein
MCFSSRLLYQLGKMQRRISAVVKRQTERALTLGHPPTITPVFICTGVLSPGERGSNIGVLKPHRQPGIGERDWGVNTRETQRRIASESMHGRQGSSGCWTRW